MAPGSPPSSTGTLHMLFSMLENLLHPCLPKFLLLSFKGSSTVTSSWRGTWGQKSPLASTSFTGLLPTLTIVSSGCN
jgi:hypothetical protein